MPTYSATTLQTPLTVALLLFEGSKLLDFAGPLQVFSDAKLANGAKAYDVHLLSEVGGSLRTDTICNVETSALTSYHDVVWDTAIVSGGSSAYVAMQSKPLRDFISKSAITCRRLGSICLGAFVLAESGLLSGRFATTHWEGSAKLSTDYPDVKVQDDAIYVEDNGIWTSAGVTAGIDMALEMVRRDLGGSEALRIAKSLVLPMVRNGGQRQFSRTLAAQAGSKGERFGDLIASVAGDLQDRNSVAEMAAKVGMSERNFARRFTEEVGVSPAQFVERLRVEHAANILHQPGALLSVVQIESGFTSQENMRRAFQRQLGISPSSYAAKFATPIAG
ncbi:helix-turn-helix domain-containing protein [Octadecabacter sp. CECT 8868]|uniref:GlxA family transcriptional regulator n=1 Tax=Octadecabacter algicola TaxID=2909342 RepID=UPI001F1F48E1|nr:helix-turn-helix domain-containing protein [Octadecabacter algicola]MCF2905005.1 helix-turn-helix domain-containing protein [Octadecabacter algicola]